MDAEVRLIRTDWEVMQWKSTETTGECDWQIMTQRGKRALVFDTARMKRFTAMKVILDQGQVP